jgi:glycosyltransferase involved in cell wall biosynthesis
MPRVSVIVPYHDAERHLARCIESLLSQSLPRHGYEIFLVDNNSRDGSAAIAARYKGVHRLSEPKRGAYAARNRAIRDAAGEIIAFTDADCEAQPDWLENIVAAIDEPHVRIVLGSMRFASDEGLLSMMAAFEAEKARYVTGQPIRERHYGYTSNMAVRRDLLDAMGPFVEMNRGSDVILVHRAIAAHGPEVIRYCSNATVRHLEIARLRDFFRKQLIYGRSTAHLGRLVSYRPLTYTERWEVFSRTVRGNGYARLQAMMLLANLVYGGTLYQAAWWRAQIGRDREAWT